MNRNASLLRQLIREIVVDVLTEIDSKDDGAPAMTQPSQPASKMFRIDSGILSERMVLSLLREHYTEICAHKRVVITPLARDTARQRGISLNTPA